ncbi:aspartate--tRNA ligase [Candidatus Woesearchaeota archaeon]|jgi:aspartyl-tRNA synthetase|nr:aspartate--tRNA ligase [Candidatus Woesearchaeota archaeon]
MKRTHTCGELRSEEIEKTVCLQGWVDSRRDHGGIIFIDMRDRYGLTQVVFNPDNSNMFELAESLRREWVIEIKGKVIPRKEGMINPNLITGEVEVEVTDLIILNKSEVPPIEIDDRKAASEEMRMKYRYLDLRRPIMQHRIKVRHDAALATREYLNSKGFLEILTPLLVRSTPEGARDYVVPSRVNPGKFYALPQSPQLYKQLLMVAGFDRYFQLPVCLRDEDLRADRQPEFTQIDIEMSFPELEDIYQIGEELLQKIMKKAIDYKLELPIPRISYDESMAKYGCDKPDIRFDLFLNDITEIAKESDFGILKSIIDQGGVVKCVNPNKDFSRKEIDAYTDFIQKLGGKGLVWLKVKDGKLEGSSAKFFSEDLQKKLIEKIDAKNDSTIFMVGGKFKNANFLLWKLRLKLGEDLNLFDPAEFKFCWVTEFPLFEWDADNERWSPCHHMFTMPYEEDLPLLDTDPGKVRASLYDLVLNGVELASGSLRIYRSDIQEKVMDVMGIGKEELENKFGFLLEAFKYGAPPHGGFAIGFDRLVALMCGEQDIREVIAFPKNKNAQCLMDNSPNIVVSEQLKEIHIKLDLVEKKKEETK